MGVSYKDYATISKVTNKHLVLQMEDKLYLHRADLTPLLSMLVKGGGKGAIHETRVVNSMEFWWLKKETRPPYIPLSAAYTAGDGHFHVANGSGAWFEENQIVFLVGKQFMVTSVTLNTSPTDDVVTVSLYPATQGDLATAPSGTNLNLSYAIYGERAEAPDGNYRDVEEEYNYCEQMMKGINLTDLMIRTAKYGQDVRKLEHQLALMNFKVDIETKFLLSQRYKDTTNDGTAKKGTIWNTGGLIPNVTDKVYDFNDAAFSYDTILEQLPDFEEFSDPNDWIWYVSTDFLVKLQQEAMDKLYLDTKDDSYGFAVKKFTTSLGDFPLVRSKIFDYIPSINNAGSTVYGKRCLLINKNELKKVNFGGLPSIAGPTLTMNAQTTREPNAKHDFYRAITGFQYGWNDKHCLIESWQ